MDHLGLKLAVVLVALAAEPAPKPAPPQYSRDVSTWEEGLHRYTLGHLERVEEAEANLGPGIFLAGAGFHGIGLNECVDSGMRAADGVVDNLSGVVSTARSGETH